MEIELLEYIASRISCEFISDIKACSGWPALSAMSRCISNINSKDCTLHEWNDAVQYITGEGIHFADNEAAKGFILRYLKRII